MVDCQMQDNMHTTHCKGYYRIASMNKISEKDYWLETERVTKWLLWNHKGTQQHYLVVCKDLLNAAAN